MNPDNTTPGGPQQRPGPEQADPYRPNNYDWQRGLAQQSPDPRIIPLPDPNLEQPMQPGWQRPAIPEAPPLVGTLPEMPEPEPVPLPQPAPVAPPAPFAPEPEPVPEPQPAPVYPKRKKWPIVLAILL